MKGLSRLWAIVAVTVCSPASAGHEMPIYPSYYPQEIRIEPLDPAAAGPALAEGRIQAYVGATPGFAAVPGEEIKSVETLGGFLVVDVNPDSPRAAGDGGACAIAGRVVASLSESKDAFRFHPYPVNGFHADYLHHADLTEDVRARLAGPGDGATGKLSVNAEGALASTLVGERWPGSAAPWDATIREIDLGSLLAGRETASNGWLGPPWLKQGWFHAYLLLADALPDRPGKRRAEVLAGRLKNGTVAGEVERINLERELVTLLTSGCRRAVAGYRLRREFFSDAFSGGVQNIGYDSHAGFNSAIFMRTVKLKDFPWNGWLAIGIDETPDAAWNPVAGFTDDAGRLIWWALGDPALFPEPYNAGWLLNRIGDIKGAGDQ